MELSEKGTIEVFCRHLEKTKHPDLKHVREGIHEHLRRAGFVFPFRLEHNGSQRLTKTKWRHTFTAKVSSFDRPFKGLE